MNDSTTHQQRLLDELGLLEDIFDDPSFGQGPSSLGAELEVAIVDQKGDAAPLNAEILGTLNDPEIQAELDLFNLEINVAPVMAAGDSLTQLEDSLVKKLRSLRSAASQFGGNIAAIGILPTLNEHDLQPEIMTNTSRYRVMSSALRRMRAENFTVDIHGPEVLQANCEDVTFEGANTSTQYHLRVAPNQFAPVFNAAQLTLPATVAIAANSPVGLGKVLWPETRIALFKQAVDYRNHSLFESAQPSRVCFGYGWVRRGLPEMFRENVALFEPLFPLDANHAISDVADGGAPVLKTLRMHQGTVWSWNRAIYDPVDGGHCRIEFRALPSGPTPIDIVANGAFAMGVALGLQDQIDQLITQLPFRYAEMNFYRAARQGMQATIFWPDATTGRMLEKPISDVIAELIPVADRGLKNIHISANDRARYLGVIEARLEAQFSPSQWLSSQIPIDQPVHDRAQLLRELTQQYVELSCTGEPAHTWPQS